MLYFNHADDDSITDPNKLKNDLESARLSVRSKDRDINELKDEIKGKNVSKGVCQSLYCKKEIVKFRL